MGSVENEREGLLDTSDSMKQSLFQSQYLLHGDNQRSLREKAWASVYHQSQEEAKTDSISLLGAIMGQANVLAGDHPEMPASYYYIICEK